MDVLPQLTTALAGRYTIDREIGAGGMATVYLARDVRHDRNVALKVLRPELGAVLGVERFLSEIRVTANLQHPNLLPLFDSGEIRNNPERDEGSTLFYVMPYVEGESLRARLDREKQLPVDEAIRIGTAVASALDYAHRHSVIHRDLKPENILLHEGQPLVADFGIALAVSNAGGQRITQTGLSLGTPQYMSPEQATGDRAIDGRTDIYSLAAVVYEMLVGDPPHFGSTAQAIIAKVLTDRPRSVRASRAAVSEHVDAALERALEKLPADRFGTAQEFSDALTGKLLARPAATATMNTSPERRSRVRSREIVWATLFVIAAAGFGWQWVGARRSSETPVIRFAMSFPRDQQLNLGNVGTPLALSPRGDRTVYYATGDGGVHLYIRSSDQLVGRLLSNESGGLRNPCFSPDGRWVAYVRGTDVKKVSVDGGPVVTLATIPANIVGISWGAPNTIAVGTPKGLYVVPAAGGAASPAMRPGARGNWPLLLPDGNRVIYTIVPATGFSGTDVPLAIMSLKDGIEKPLGVHGSSPLGVVSGYLVYATADGTLMAVAFDERHDTTSGASVPVVQDVEIDVLGGARASLSAAGTLLYLSGKSENQPFLVDSRGMGKALIHELHNYSAPRFSPDGKRIAINVTTARSADIWVYDLASSTLTRLPNEGQRSLRPEWTADGKRLVFVAFRGERTPVMWQPADGSRPAEILFEPDEPVNEALLSPDGKWLVYRTSPGARQLQSVFAVPMTGDRKPVPIVVAPTATLMPRFSPDGKWLAYQSTESGRYEIYVRPFPESGARIQLSFDSGTGSAEAVWARSGRALYYRSGDDLVGVNVTTGAKFSIGERKVVLAGSYVAGPSHANYDPSPDGEHFLMIRRAGEDVQAVIVFNWARELAARMAAPQR